MLGRTVLLTAAVVVALVAPAAAYDPQPRAIFGAPGNNQIREAILLNINGTPNGGSIEGVSWSFTDTGVSDALIAAHRRGVRVRVLVGGQSGDASAVTSMREGFAKRNFFPFKTPKSSVTVSVGASRKNPRLGTGAMHQKSWTFSKVGNVPFVSIVTSANVTGGANDQQFNDGWQFANFRAPYSILRNMFKQQIRKVRWGNPFRQYDISPQTGLTFSPWNAATMADPVVRRIQALPPRVTIRVANGAWSGARGVAIARALAAKKRAGADVAALYGQPVGPEVLRTLQAAGIPAESVWFSPERYLHGKFMTARWGNDTRVWTGSENWGDAPKAADELVARVGSPDAYKSFTDWWEYLRSL